MSRAPKGVLLPILIGLVALALLFVSTPSSQQLGLTRYVNNTDPTCNGRSPCYSTIQAAVNAALPGDAVQIQAGTYAEQLTISGKNNISTATESDRIVIEADPALAPGSVVVRPPTASCLNGHAVLIRQSKFVTLRGLTITGAVGAGVVLLGGSQQNQAIHIERSRIFGNSSPSCPVGGIVIALGNPDTLIVNNLIHGNGGNGIGFADLSGGPHWLIENTIHGNGWNGVGILLGNTVTLANNLITGNGQATGTLGGRHGVRRTGLPGQAPEAVDLLNNLICGNRLGEISGPVLDNTDAGNLTPQGNEGPGVSASPGCEIPANVYADVDGLDNLPNTADDDFTLRSSSPAIDRGMDPRTLGLSVLFNSILEADFSTEAARPSDGNADRSLAFDIGALEFPNQPPVANAGPDQTVFRGELVTLNGSASSDPEGATLTFQWTLVSQPQGSSVTLTNPTSISPQFTPLIVGNYLFELVVNDGESDSAPDTVQISVVNRPPTANAGGPYTGQLNTPIQFSGSGNDPDGDTLSFNWDFGDGSTPLTTGGGTTSTPSHTYTAPGTFTVTLTVSDPFGGSAISQTTATVTAALVLNPIGNKTVNLGETLIFTVSATSPTVGPISLFVEPLPLPNHATFNAVTGEFRFTPDTTQVGNFQLKFSATNGNQSDSETITITVPQPPPNGITAVRGRIYNLNNTPLGNVKVTLKSSGHTAFSATDGFFTISGVPFGRQELIINGREANLGVFAILAVPVDLIEGVLNNLPSAITLPDVDVDAEVQVSPTFTTVVSNPAVPGVELTIPGGTAKNSDGTPFTGKLSINPVPDYGRPESRPEELRPGMAITIQPAGVRFNPPARLTFPNADGMSTGSELNLWSLSPDTGTFNLVGKGVVSQDGQSIITVEGGVSASAWHFFLAPSVMAQSSAVEGNFCGGSNCPFSSEVNLQEGSLFLNHTLPSYRSLGQSRSLTLTYSSVTADARPIVSLDTALSRTPLAAAPNTFSMRLEVGGVQQGAETFTDTSSLLDGDDRLSRLSVQFDASNLSTGFYPYKATVFSNYGNSSIGAITSGNVIVLNRKASPLGAGWSLTDIQQLYLRSDGTALLTTGGGVALSFSGGPDTFTSPQGDFSTLIRNPDGSFSRTLKDGTKVNFDAQGLQTSVVDRNGKVTIYTYDGSSRLLAIADPAGLITSFTYSGGKLQKITDPAGRETTFQHDAQGNLIRIDDPDGSFVTYVYDDKNRITQATDARGNTTQYFYDFAGRFAQSIRPTGETRSFVSTRLRGLANMGGGQGTPTNPAPMVPSANATSAFTDARGSSTTLLLDSLGQITSQVDALANTTSIERDLNGNPTKITRPNGAVLSMTYDARGNLLTSTDPIGAATTFTYEPSFNQVTSIKDPKGNTTTITYDLKGNPTEIIDALGNRTQMTYDARGLLTSVTSAVGKPEQNTTSFTYDARGNLLTTTDPKGNISTLDYDNAGNVIRSTDAEGRVTEFTYDAMNRLVSVLDPDLKVTRYTYDAKGNLTEVIDAKLQKTTFTYDPLDRLTFATNPLGLTETFTYDVNGNLTSTTSRNGQTITFEYDALSRLISKTRPPTTTEVGPQVTTFDYDALGNLVAATNPVTDVFNQYDLANRLVSSISTMEGALANTTTEIIVDTLIDENNRQFEGKSIQVNGKVLTLNGSHTFVNLTLLNGAVLTHVPTTGTKIGKVDLKLTGALQIDATSRIDVTGRGFLGGFKPGNPFTRPGMTSGFQRGSLQGVAAGTGGSYGGLGGAPADGVPNPVYRDFRDPDEPGSGGSVAGVSGGTAGNGGGLIRIVAQTLQLDGIIRANGETTSNTNAAGGGGGGIRIDVETLRGAGQITANGGNGVGTTTTNGGGGGGGGRAAIYYQNLQGFDVATQVTAFGGTGFNAPNGGAGTIYLQGPANEDGDLVIDNNNLAATTLSTPIVPLTSSLVPLSSTVVNLTNLSVRRAARVRIDSLLNITGTLEVAFAGEFVSTNKTNAWTINLNNNGLITHLPTTGTAFFKVDLNADSLTVDATSRIDVTGLGFLGGFKPGNPFTRRGMTVGFQAGSLQGVAAGTGGSYGGLGGAPADGTPNPVYGDFRDPNNPGSGGSVAGVSGGTAGNGGGLIRIVAGTLQLDGVIGANGETTTSPTNAAGGSGGGIRIDAETLTGTGQITANGGNGVGTTTTNGGGGGGGGRVAVYYQNAAGFDLNKGTAIGGNGFNAPNGGAGTVYLQGPGRENGEVVVDNNNVLVGSLSTPILTPPSGSILLTHFRVRRAARVRVDSLLNLTGTLEVALGGEFISTNRTVAGTININNNGLITHLPTTASQFFKVDLAADTLAIDATSRIDVTALGFLGGFRAGNPFTRTGMTIGFAQGSTGSAGGGYGGLGGALAGGSSNPIYGDFRDPNEPGSGGSTAGISGSGAGNGGGLIRIIAQTLQLDGLIKADGESRSVPCCVGGGSGGGIRIDVMALTGAGQIIANGGNGVGSGSTGGGGGGGGRIAIYFQNVAGFDLTKVTAFGGVGNAAPNGQNGTVHIEQTLAMQAPTDSAAPVMLASLPDAARLNSPSLQLASLALPVVELEPDHVPVRIPDFKELIVRMQSESPAADLPQRRVFSPSQLEADLVSSSIQDPKPVLSEVEASAIQNGSVLIAQSSSLIAQNRLSELLPTACCLLPADADPIYTYDPNGNRISMIDPTGLTTYEYDALNRLTSITNNKGITTTFTYDALGRRTSMTHGNGVVTNYEYDPASQLTKLAHQLGATTINSFEYSYDRVGNRKTKADGNGTAGYTYDTLNRLVEAINPLPTNPLENFQYDAVGNRTTSNQNGASSFNTANQLLEDSAFTYVYDANGNQSRKTSKATGELTQFEYTAENQLVRVVRNGTTINYRYDGLGRRVEKEVNDGATTNVTRYILDQEDVLLELDGSNNIVARYTHGPEIDEPLIVERTGQSFFYHADGLGSITELTDAAGSVIQAYTYSSFGKIESQFDPNFIQPYTFTARELDPETGLYFYRARTYDFKNGRFLQEDPILHAGNPDFPYLLLTLLRFPRDLHPHVYVANNPLFFVDPQGLSGASGSWGRGASGTWTTAGNGNMWGGYTPQDWICTDPAGSMNQWSCTKQCCVDHDGCYQQFGCNSSSWVGNFLPPSWAKPCQMCNAVAVGCMIGNWRENEGCCK